MGRYRQLGRWVRTKRTQRGLTAVGLSRAAGVGETYVSQLERGNTRPKPGIVKAIADVLNLSDAERAEFYRLSKVAGDPEALRETLPPPIFPGSALWATFPALAIRKRVTAVEPFGAADTLRFLPPGLRALASLLAAVAVFDDDVPALVITRVRRAALAANRQLSAIAAKLAGVLQRPENGPNSPPRPPAELLPALFQAELLAHRRSVERLTNHLQHWDSCPLTVSEGARVRSRELFSATFLLPERHKRFGVAAADPALCAAVHDALVCPRLWDALGLAADFGPFSPSQQPLDEFESPLRWARQAALAPASFETESLIAGFDLSCSLHNLRLVGRLFTLGAPSVGRAMLSIDQPELERLVAALESARAGRDPAAVPPNPPDGPH